MTHRPLVLVVDDEDDIRETLSAHLRKMGFDVVEAESARAARSLLADTTVDLVVLDIMMPGEDGLSFCRHLQEVGNTPVILLTALGDDTDKIVGLEVGADDYLTKPFNPRELIARIRAVLRRSGERDETAPNTSPRSFSNWSLNEEQSELIRDDNLVVALSTGELDLLLAFLTRSDEVLSRDDLMQLTRGRDALAFERSIDNTIARLRKKIEVDPTSPRIIKTVRGGGYRLVSKRPS